MTTTFLSKRMTMTQYLHFDEQVAEKHEFVNGKLTKMSGGTFNHNQIAANLLALLKNLLKTKAHKYYVLGSDMKIYIPELDNIRYPDVVVIAEKPEFFRRRKDVITNPLLIVEVISPSTSKFDTNGKFEEYQSIPTLQDYVVVSQEAPYVSVFHREAADLWRSQVCKKLSGNVPLKSIEVEMPLVEVFDGVKFRKK
jgi:Uma2 family endonuclease